MTAGRRSVSSVVIVLSLASVARVESAETPTEPVRSERSPSMEMRPARTPWRAAEALEAPSWLRFGLAHRTRFEHLRNEFRAGMTGNSTALTLRTFLSAELGTEPVVFGLELQDARAYASEATPLNTSLVDALDLLQAYGSLRLSDVLKVDDRAALTLGRFTLDIGSRRLVSRSDFRNTMSAFTGVDLHWSSRGGQEIRTFAVLPVAIFPSDAAGLEENRIELDRENTDALFWGLFYGSGALALSTVLEVYCFGLYERDAPRFPSWNRSILTPGLRLFRAPADGALDFQAEGMLQVGSSRSSSNPADERDLDHRAFSGHVSVGYRFDVPARPRVAVAYDIATGDRDAGDGVNQRFDPLFGDRRFEFGPTGIYGAVARSNVSSPGLRFELAPSTRLDLFSAYRAVWLESERDAWTSAGLRDPTGESGSFIGHQIEARLRWHVLPENLMLELGGAHLVKGKFARSVPGGRADPATYVYSAISGSI
jgi:hypothetical protein